LTRNFSGNDFFDQMNQVLALKNQAIDSMQMTQSLAQNGTDGTAEVVSITAT
jgi:hypothetical protein